MSDRPAVLSERQRKFLRGRAHPLHPVVRIGQSGLTDAVAAETARALHDHELIKIKVRGSDRASRDALLEQLIAQTGSTLVTRIGHVAVLYKRHPRRPRLVIPDA